MKMNDDFKRILFTRYTFPIYLISIFFVIILFGEENEYISRIKSLTAETEGFNIMKQLFIPGFAGMAGGFSTVIISSLDTKYIQHNHVFSKFMSIGFIAGVAAVNLLNPSGTVSQVMILGLLAGLSGFSYLERSALVQAESEKKALINIDKNEFLEKHNKPVERDFNSGTEEQLLKKLEQDVFNQLKNIQKGSGDS